MSFLQVDFYSNALGRSAQMDVTLPEGPPPEGGFPTLYLLHGMTDDYSVWMRRTSIERYAEDRGLAVVMPDTRLCWYADTASGERYFEHVSDEVVHISRRMLPGLSHLRGRTFAAGVSMGGYGALRCGLERPERFSRVACLSGALDVAAMDVATLPGLQSSPDRDAYWEDLFGPADEIAGTDNDLFRAAESLSGQRPSVWLWCGAQDYLLAHSRRMRDHLRALGYDLTYSESPGAHLWVDWDAQIQRALDWMIAGREASACR